MGFLLIKDGYTLKGSVEAKGPRSELKFTYRPALAERVADYLAAKKDTGKQAHGSMIAIVHEHLQTWNVVDEKEEPVAINKETLKLVPYPVLDKLLDYITGYSLDDQKEDQKN